MNCSNIEWVDNYDYGDYKYILTKGVKFKSLSGIDFGDFKAYDKNNRNLLIEAKNDYILFYPGYAWDGCSFIGTFYENNGTLLSSILHDGLYQVGKQNGYKSTFSLYEADNEFRWQLAANKVCAFLRDAYWVGTASFGIFWKKGTTDTLIIK